MSINAKRFGLFGMIALMGVTVALIGLSVSTTPMDSTIRDAVVAELQPLRPMRDPASVKWVWLRGPRNALGERVGLCASYRALTDSVAVPRYLADMAADRLMAPTYAHELTHAAQCKRWGFLGYEWRKTFSRTAVEAEAVAEENRVAALVEGSP